MSEPNDNERIARLGREALKHGLPYQPIVYEDEDGDLHLPVDLGFLETLQDKLGIEPDDG